MCSTQEEMFFLVGTMQNGANARPCVKVLDDPFNLASSTNYGNFFYFSLMSNEINARTKSTILKDGFIAVSYVHHESPTNMFYKRIRIINTDTLNPQNINSQEFEIVDKLETLEMAYSLTTRKLVLLQEPLNSFVNDPHFYFLEPNNTSSYMANESFFQNGNPYCSLDIYHQDNFVSVGMSNAYLQFIPYQTNLGCPYGRQILAKRITDLTSYIYPSTVFRPTITYAILNYNLYTYPCLWSPNCNNQF